MRVPLGGKKKVRGIVVSTEDRAPDIGVSSPEVKDVAGVVIETPLVPPGMVALYRYVARRYVTAFGRCLELAVPPRVRIKTPVPAEIAPGPIGEGTNLVEGYEGGIELLRAISSGAEGTCLLRTAPGEDHGRVIAELVAVAAGAGAAIVCVPEVRYGSATIDFLAERFPGLVRVDASMSEGERSRGWLAAAAGAPLIAGGRSAVFAPAPQLRLVVVDEEHNPTYKEDRAPRYDARLIARERARMQGAVCVLISSTPSLETYGAARRSAIRYAAPPRAAEKAARPLVEVAGVDRERSIGAEVHRRIKETLDAGDRVGVLAPAAGFARAVWCASCRRSVRCPRCEAGMNGGEGLSCPRCGLGLPMPETCPSCGAAELRMLGAGSRRLTEQVAKAFPRARVVRVDPDVLEEGEILDVDAADIYLTTWIGTKQALRPEVSTVAVLEIDRLIRRPDLRAAERAYQMLAEMAGWAGSRSSGGRLIVQTDEPSHHAVQAVVRGDYSFFADREMALRKELGYPPYSELVKVTAAGEGASELVDRAASLARGAQARVLGPIGVARSALGEGAVEILIKCRAAVAVSDALAPLARDVPAGTRLRIDVDPR